MALMIIPLPSFQRSVEITNQFTTAVGVRCKTLDGKKEQSFRLEPEGHWKFVYFAGDHGNATTIPVLVEAVLLSNGVKFQREVQLPIDHPPLSGITLSADWFEPKAMP